MQWPCFRLERKVFISNRPDPMIRKHDVSPESTLLNSSVHCGELLMSSLNNRPFSDDAFSHIPDLPACRRSPHAHIQVKYWPIWAQFISGRNWLSKGAAILIDTGLKCWLIVLKNDGKQAYHNTPIRTPKTLKKLTWAYLDKALPMLRFHVEVREQIKTVLIVFM